MWGSSESAGKCGTRVRNALHRPTPDSVRRSGWAGYLLDFEPMFFACPILADKFFDFFFGNQVKKAQTTHTRKCGAFPFHPPARARATNRENVTTLPKRSESQTSWSTAITGRNKKNFLSVIFRFSFSPGFGGPHQCRKKKCGASTLFFFVYSRPAGG